MSSLRQQYANESIESFCFLKNGASRSFEFPLYPSMNWIIPLFLIKLLSNQKIQPFTVGKGCSNCYCSYAELVMIIGCILSLPIQLPVWAFTQSSSERQMVSWGIHLFDHGLIKACHVIKLTEKFECLLGAA